MSSTKTQQTQGTKMCKFCKGAGEPVSVYTSHWQFSKPVNGSLTCPKLLNYKCQNCSMTGHVENRCKLPRAFFKKSSETNSPKKQFCGFCKHGAGTDWESHATYNDSGDIVCPVLIATECKQCGDFGHTRKNCKVKMPIARIGESKETKVVTGVLQKLRRENPYSLLITQQSDDSESGEDTVKISSEEAFPELSSSNKKSTKSSAMLTGWNTMAAKPMKSAPLETLSDTVTQLVEKNDEDSEDDDEHIGGCVGYCQGDSYKFLPGSSWAEVE